MLRPELGEEFPDGSHIASAGVFEALPDSFASVRLRGDVEQALIGFGILNHGPSLAFDGEHHGALGLLELLHKITGPAAEGGERLNVFSDIEHEGPYLWIAPF